MSITNHEEGLTLGDILRKAQHRRGLIQQIQAQSKLNQDLFLLGMKDALEGRPMDDDLKSHERYSSGYKRIQDQKDARSKREKEFDEAVSSLVRATKELAFVGSQDPKDRPQIESEFTDAMLHIKTVWLKHMGLIR